jgi:hypothetical protein
MQSVDLKKRRRAVKIANAVNSIEGVPVSKEVKLIQARFANGELTSEQMKTEVISFCNSI